MFDDLLGVVGEVPLHLIGLRLIETTGKIVNEDGQVVATGDGKYVPLDEKRHREFIATFVNEPATAEAARSGEI